MRASLIFQNVPHRCKTLTERHQLLPSYICHGHLFPFTVQLQFGAASEYDEQLYNGLIQEAIRAVGFTKETVSEVSAVV